MSKRFIYLLLIWAMSFVNIYSEIIQYKDNSVTYGLTYELDTENNTARLWRGQWNTYWNSYNSQLNGHIEVPYEITKDGKNYKVIFDGERTFENCRNITSIYIDSENVPEAAFANSSIQDITFGPHVKYVANKVFENYNLPHNGHFNLVFDGSIESVVSGSWISNLGNNIIINLTFNDPNLPDIDSSFFSELNRNNNNPTSIVVPENAVIPDSWSGNVPGNVPVTTPSGTVVDPTQPGPIGGDTPDPGEPGLSFDIIDTDPSSFPDKDGSGSISYTRSFSNTESWQALFVPFTMKGSKWREAGLQVAKIMNIHRYDSNGDGNNDSWLLELKKLKDTDDVVANYPYLVKASSVGSLTVADDDCVIRKPSTANEITCWSTEVKYTFVTVTSDFNQWSTARTDNSKVYVLSGGQLKEVVAQDGKSTLRALRWYMKATPTDPDCQMAEGGVSSISNVKARMVGDDKESVGEFVGDDEYEDSKTFFTTDGINFENSLR